MEFITELAAPAAGGGEAEAPETFWPVEDGAGAAGGAGGAGGAAPAIVDAVRRGP